MEEMLNTNISKTKAEEIKYYLPQDKKLTTLADFFSMFSDATRLKIISALSISEMCVGDISKILNINQTTISHQLKILKSTSLVKYRRDGKVIYYSIADPIINECLSTGVDYIKNVNYF